jgi:hypothetical protein
MSRRPEIRASSGLHPSRRIESFDDAADPCNVVAALLANTGA